MNWSDTFHSYLISDAMFYPRIQNAPFLRKRNLTQYLDKSAIVITLWKKKDRVSERVEIDVSHIMFGDYADQKLFKYFVQMARKKMVNLIVGFSYNPTMETVFFRI